MGSSGLTQFFLNGIQEVSGSIPLSSTRKQQRVARHDSGHPFCISAMSRPVSLFHGWTGTFIIGLPRPMEVCGHCRLTQYQHHP